MGLFNIFKKNSKEALGYANRETLIGSSEERGIEHPSEKSNETLATPVEGILTIYNYLQKDFEEIGYHDSFISPDDSYKHDNIRLIKFDLEILIHKVMTYYDSMLKELDFHIHSRSRAGLVDLVEELKVRKEDVLEHIQKVSALALELKSESGLCERAFLSYKRGFMKGMASITQANLLSKPL